MRLVPYPPDHFLHILGRTYYQAGRYREAVEVLDRLRARRPEWDECDAFIATIAAEAGYQDIAKVAVARLIKANPDASVEYYATMNFTTGLHKDREREELRFANGLRKAGLPE